MVLLISRVSTFLSLERTQLELTKTCAVEPHFTLPLADCWWWTWARMTRSLNPSWLQLQVSAVSAVTMKQSGMTDSLSKPFGLRILILLSLRNCVKILIFFAWKQEKTSCFAERASNTRVTCEWHALCASSLQWVKRIITLHWRLLPVSSIRDNH